MEFLARVLCAAALVAAFALPATSLADDDDDGPSAGSVAASAVTQDSARVTGVITLGEEDASYWFEYGSSGAQVKQTPLATASHDQDDKHHRVTVSATLTGLPAATRHYVRLVASDEDGRATSPLTTFTTAAAAASPGKGPATPAQPGGAPPTGTAQPVAPAPELGKTVVVAEASGVVRIRLRGSDEFIGLEAAASIPVGSVIDASRGSVALNAARSPAGASQEARFGGGRFVVRQSLDGHGYTDLYLRGRGFGRCADRDSGGAVASAATKRRKGVRRLWGRDHGGRFRTHGRDSVATVRGTRWTMIDRCDGTLTKVTEGAVDVRVRRTGRVVRVSAGERHFARHRR
jgi:hypothetical protein